MDGKHQHKIDFEGLSRALLNRVREFLPAWLPGGKLVGQEYSCGNLRGEQGDSLKVNINTGKWMDFATGDKGGDLISLYAAVEGITQGEAARRLQEQSGYVSQLPAAKPAKPEPVIGPPPEGSLVPSCSHKQFGEPSSRWVYQSEQGKVLFYVCRYDPTGERKQFIPWSWDGSRWVPKAWPAPRPLYGLELLKKYPSRPVLIVEGEKACEAARKIAGHVYVVVTWSSGSKAYDKTNWTPVHGRRVLIWPDSDKPGRAASLGLAELLHPHCKEIKILNVDDLPDGHDAADLTFADFKEFVAWAKPRAELYGAAPEPAKQQVVTPVADATIVMPSNPKPSSSSVSPGHTLVRQGDTNSSNISIQINAESPDDLPVSIYAIHEQLGITTSQNGSPVANVDNVLKFIEGWPDLKDLVWFDEFYHRIFTQWHSDQPREWTDVDDLELTVYLQRRMGLLRISTETVSNAVLLFANRNKRNEPMDWMASRVWDQVPRLDTFFMDAYGADDNEYTRAVSRNFWISLVARAFQPACQVDNMVVIEGLQGTRKSSSLSIIGGKWYAEAHKDVGSDDFLLGLHGNLLVEIGELSSFSRAERNRVKQMITCRVDEFRPKYGRHSKKFPRRCIFVGTTNDDEYLNDPTGARRYWPMKTRGDIDIGYITEMREQFFAEAVVRFKQQEPWWIIPGELAEKEQELRRQVDPWEEVLEQYLIGNFQISEVTARQLAVDALGFENQKIDRKVDMRITDALKKLKWKKGGRGNTEHGMSRFWKRPERRSEL